MKALLIAAITLLFGLSVPAFAECGAAHPQALSAPNTVLAQSSDSNSTMKNDEGNKQDDDDDDN